MELRRLVGHHESVETVVHNRIMLSKAPNGEWLALNHYSEDPVRLRNRTERSTWALTMGLKVKDVEAYVRRAKRQEAKQSEIEQLDEAIQLVKSKGYTLNPPVKE